MSDPSSERPQCRDYVRGVCNRGSNCKYYHPEGVSPVQNGKLPICKDFQNKGCSRMKCKFLHITAEEEAAYNNTGVLPEHGGRPEKSTPSFEGMNVCKDFLNNTCSRGNRCKYFHPSNSSMGIQAPSIYGKRQRADDFDRVGDNSAALLEENELLKRKITDLQRQVIDLRQMNDTLYDQNTRYRIQLRSSATVESQPDPYAMRLAPTAVATATAEVVPRQGTIVYNYPQY